MEHKFYSNIKFHFNLRTPKLDKPTPIYFVVSLNGKQIKLSTNVKIFPRHWDNKSQTAIISNINSRLDNRNNKIVNDRLKQVQSYYSEFIAYLCNLDKTPTNIVEVLKSFIYKDMAYKKSVTIDVIKTIKDAFKYYYTYLKEVKPHSLYINETNLKRFISYIQENNLNNEVEVFRQTGLNAYRDYLINLMNNEESFGKKRINILCEIIERLINNVLIVNKEYQQYNFTPVKYVKLEDKRQQDEIKRFPLYNNEIQAIKDCKTLTSRESDYRNIFLLQCACGQRISDILQIVNGNYTEKDGIITLQTIKKGTYAQIYLTDEIRDYIKKIQQIKGINFEKFNDGYYNQYLRKICKKSGLNRLYKWKDSRGKEYENPICELMVSHNARHTFITNKIKEGYDPNVLCEMTGHIDDKMIKEVYANLTKEDRADKVRNYHKAKKETTESKDNSTSTISNVMELLKPDENVSVYEFDSDLINPDIVEVLSENTEFIKRFCLSESDIEFLSNTNFPTIEIGFHSLKMIKQIKRLMERGLIVCIFKGRQFPDQLQDIKINPIYE